MVGLGLLLPNSVSRWSFGQGVLAIAVFGLERDEVQPAQPCTRDILPHRLLQDSPTMNYEPISCYSYHL